MTYILFHLRDLLKQTKYIWGDSNLPKVKNILKANKKLEFIKFPSKGKKVHISYVKKYFSKYDSFIKQKVSTNASSQKGNQLVPS